MTHSRALMIYVSSVTYERRKKNIKKLNKNEKLEQYFPTSDVFYGEIISKDLYGYKLIFRHFGKKCRSETFIKYLLASIFAFLSRRDVGESGGYRHFDEAGPHVNEEIPEVLSLNLFDSNWQCGWYTFRLAMKVEIAFPLSSFPEKLFRRV